MLSIFMRLLITYTILIATMRFMGKRQIGELQISELVTTILLSELAAQPVIDSKIPLIYAIISIGTLISIEVIISFTVTKIPILKPVFDGKPSILISKGKLDIKEVQRVRISLEELLSQLRIAGVADISDVNYAILEQNGQLSVITKKYCSPPDREDLNLKIKESGIAHAIIIDSKISEYNLKQLGKSHEWLNSRLKHHKIKMADIVLFTVDDTGKENLVRR